MAKTKGRHFSEWLEGVSGPGAIMIIHVTPFWAKPLAIGWTSMDIIQQCLSLAPVPYLAPAFSVFRFICSTVEQAQASKQQLQALSQTIAQLLSTLNTEYRAGRLLQTKTSTPVADLIGFVAFIAS
jgi:hypothetical protein